MIWGTGQKVQDGNLLASPPSHQGQTRGRHYPMWGKWEPPAESEMEQGQVAIVVSGQPEWGRCERRQQLLFIFSPTVAVELSAVGAPEHRFRAAAQLAHCLRSPQQMFTHSLAFIMTDLLEDINLDPGFIGVLLVQNHGLFLVFLFGQEVSSQWKFCSWCNPLS